MSWSAPLRRRLARLAPYTHLVMLAGVVCTAAGFDLVIDRPTGGTPARWTALIFGGPALFVLGRTLFTYWIAGMVPWHRVLWPLALAAAAPWVGGWPPALVTALPVMLLAGVVVVDAMAGRLTRPMRRERPERAAQGH